jgi:hypothetical protein
VIAGGDCIPDRVAGHHQPRQLSAGRRGSLGGQQLQGVHRGQVGHAPAALERGGRGGLTGGAHRRGQISSGQHARVAVQQDCPVGDTGRRGDVSLGGPPFPDAGDDSPRVVGPGFSVIVEGRLTCQNAAPSSGRTRMTSTGTE